jgi:hypothetical protein
MQRWDIINALIKKNGYKTYSEIGTQYGTCFTKVLVEHKECVDPEKVFDGLTHVMTSDEYFAQNTKTFDIIFIDGLHTEAQTRTDILNALNVLNPGGTIVAHDCLPDSREATAPWYCGTSYMAAIWFRINRPDVIVNVVDTDAGCGVFRKGTSETYTKATYEQAREYDYYAANKKELMNVLTVNEFRSNYSL